MEEKNYCPLKNERVIVRRLLKEGKITNPKHVLYGGMAETAKKIISIE